MAPETVKYWKEEREKRACCPVEGFDVPNRDRFGILEGAVGFGQRQRCDL